jgi:hypothetical protein
MEMGLLPSRPPPISYLPRDFANELTLLDISDNSEQENDRPIPTSSIQNRLESPLFFQKIPRIIFDVAPTTSVMSPIPFQSPTPSPTATPTATPKKTSFIDDGVSSSIRKVFLSPRQTACNQLNDTLTLSLTPREVSEPLSPVYMSTSSS